MEETPTPIANRGPGSSLGDSRVAILTERREAARQAIGDAQARLLRLQDELTRAAADWRGQQSAWEERQRRAAEELAERSARIAEQEMLRTREAADATERQQEQAATLAERSGLLDERESALSIRSAELDEREAEIIQQLAAAETLGSESEQRRAELDARAKVLQREAEELSAARQAKAEEQDTALAEAAAESRSQIEALRSQLAALTTERHAEQTAWTAREQELVKAADAARTACDELNAKTSSDTALVERSRSEAAARAAEVEKWRAQAAELETEVEQLKELVAAAPQVDPSRVSDLEKRLQMAIDELRNERQRAAEIQKQLSEARQAAHSPSNAAGGALDWEAQKRKLLQSLEDDFDQDSAADKEDRLSIEETIRVTSHVVDAKEREIDELRKLLEQQSSNFGSVAVGAAALADLVDKDELLQQERQKAVTLQEEWQVKLRQAEVELSLERAKLARERVELEERLRRIEQAESSRASAQDTPPAAGKKSSGGRWLTRLGLRDSEG